MTVVDSTLGAVNVAVSLPDRSAMLSLPPAPGLVALVKDDARGGVFDCDTSDHSSTVTADPGAVRTVPFTSDPTGASGVWIHRKMTRFDPRRAGAIGDTYGNNTSPDDWEALQYAMRWAAYEGSILEIDRPYRVGQANKGRASNAITQVGQLTLASNMYVEGLPDCRIYPVGFSRSGSIFTNLWTQEDPRSLVDNVVMSNIVVDMIDYEPIVWRGTIESATLTTVKLRPVDNEGRVTSTVDGWYNNLQIQIMRGPGQTEYAYLKNYVGATREAQILKTKGTPPLNTQWATIPDDTSLAEVGWNDCLLGLSGGFRNGRFYDWRVYRNKLGILGAGGKAANCENGVEDVIIQGLYGESIGGALAHSQGHAGYNNNGSRRWVRKVVFRDFTGVDCGALIAASGQDGSADPDGNPDDKQVRFQNGHGERVGHMDQRVSAEKVKNAAIVLEEAENVLIENVVIDNGSWEPAYTTDDYRVGHGLTGMPHGMQGWARNAVIRNLSFYGNYGSLYSLQRNRAFGSDAGPTGKPQNTYRVHVEDIKHQGALDSYPFIVSDNAALRPDDGEVRMRFDRISLNSDPAAVFDPNMAVYTGIMVKDISDWLNSRTVDVDLSAKRFIELGNTIASVKARTSSKTFRKTGMLTYDIGSAVPSQGERSFNIPVSGVYLAENNSVNITMDGTHAAGISLHGEVTADGIVTVYVINITTVAKTLGSRTYTARVDTVIE